MIIFLAPVSEKQSGITEFNPENLVLGQGGNVLNGLGGGRDRVSHVWGLMVFDGYLDLRTGEEVESSQIEVAHIHHPLTLEAEIEGSQVQAQSG